MSLWRRVQRLFCPACVSNAPMERRHPAVVILERSAEALDRMLERMSDDDNPMLGEKPRVPRRDRP